MIIMNGKRMICCIAALALALSGGSAAVGRFEVLHTEMTASADETKDGVYGDYLYNVINGEAVIAGYTGTATSISIPSEIDGMKVTGIAGYAFDGSGVTKVVIPDSVEWIGESAFANCITLLNVSIPDSVTEIMEHCFDGCISIRELTLPAGLKTIGYRAFGNCKSLKSIEIPNSAYEIGSYAFQGCDDLKDVFVPESVSDIGEYAFGFDDTGKMYREFLLSCKHCSAAEKYAEKFGVNYVVEEPIVYENPAPAVTADTDSVTLKWDPVPYAEKYAVCVLSDGNWRKVKETADNSYVLKGLTPDTEYKVAVIAMFEGGWYANFDKALTVKTDPEPYKVIYPELISITINKQYHQVKLDWEGVQGAEQYGVAILVNGKWKVQGCTKTTSFITPKLRPGAVYTLAVCAKVNGKWDTSKIAERAFKLYAL